MVGCGPGLLHRITEIEEGPLILLPTHLYQIAGLFKEQLFAISLGNRTHNQSINFKQGKNLVFAVYSILNPVFMLYNIEMPMLFG